MTQILKWIEIQMQNKKDEKYSDQVVWRPMPD